MRKVGRRFLHPQFQNQTKPTNPGFGLSSSASRHCHREGLEEEFKGEGERVPRSSLGGFKGQRNASRERGEERVTRSSPGGSRRGV